MHSIEGIQNASLGICSESTSAAGMSNSVVVLGLLEKKRSVGLQGSANSLSKLTYPFLFVVLETILDLYPRTIFARRSRNGNLVIVIRKVFQNRCQNELTGKKLAHRVIYYRMDRFKHRRCGARIELADS